MNFSLREVELRQKNINSISKKKSYRRNEIMKYLRGLFLVLFFVLACRKMFLWVDGTISKLQPVGDEELLSSGGESKIYDSNGDLLRTVDTSELLQKYVSIDKIPDSVQKAFVVGEDKIFDQHQGVNARGVLEDFYARLTQQSETPGARYTITQQLIRNQMAKKSEGGSFFQRLRNVIEEQYTAIVLEDTLSKDEILEYYLNTVNLGNHILGVAAASEKYFGKDISDLNISEAAVLAAVSKNPSGFQPASYEEENRQERMRVLKGMLDEKYISEDEYGDALGDDVYLRIRNHVSEEKEEKKQTDSYYSDAVIEQVIFDLQRDMGYSATEAVRMVYSKELQIYSCQDSSIQKICDDVVSNEKYYPVLKKKKKKELSPESKTQTSFVLIEQKTGAVRAIVGGRGEDGKSDGVNRAVSLERQPGTLFDALSVYTPAIDTSGMTLGDVEDDTEYQYPDTSTPVTGLDDEKHQGLITLRDALVFSKEVPAVKVLEKVSVEVGYDYLKSFGFTTLVEKKREVNVSERNGSSDQNDFQLKMGLGQLADGVTNLELTSAYSAFANEGAYMTPKFYTKVLDKNGKVLLKKTEDRKQIMKKSTAWLLTDAMKNEPIQLEKNLYEFSRDGIAVSGKSGRTENNTDVWYMGYTPYYTFGIWAGEDEGNPLESTVYVTTMWRDIMERVHKYKNVKRASFKKPEDIISRKICTKCGRLAVSGLCDQTEEENVVRTEYFEQGTEPKKKCSCHVKYTFCKASHKLATEKCPKEQCYEKVFLKKKETSETEDSEFLFQEYSDGSVCDVH